MSEDITYSSVNFQSKSTKSSSPTGTGDDNVTYSAVNIQSRNSHHGGEAKDDSSHPITKKESKGAGPRLMVLLIFLSVLLLVIAITIGALYIQVLNELENAASERKETGSQLTKQLRANDNLTKENTKLKTELQALQVQVQRKCADNWEYFNGSCYYFSSDEKNWNDSRDACVAMGGHLIIIDSEAEMDFLKQKKKGDRLWIGLSWDHQKRNWFWLDNTSLNQQKFWKNNEPSSPEVESCAEILGDGLNDAPCNRTFQRICESKSCRT